MVEFELVHAAPHERGANLSMMLYALPDLDDDSINPLALGIVR
jgi:hypothetical protein